MPAKKPTPLTVPGRKPAALPDVESALEALRDALAAIEAMPDEQLREAQLRREALVREWKAPALARALLDLLPMDLGEFPDNPDWTPARTSAQRKQLDKSFSELVRARFARERTFETLYAIAAQDLAFQSRAFAGLGALPPCSHLFRVGLFHALVTAPVLAPEVRDAVERLAVCPGDPCAGAAVHAAFKQGLGESLLLPFLEKASSEPELRHAKVIVEQGAAGGWFARAQAAWGPLLERVGKRADEPYDWTKGDAHRASLQLGVAAREALRPPAPEASRPASRQQRAPRPEAPIEKPPLDRKKLRSGAQREAALDLLGEWVVDKLDGASDDQARAILRGAIAAFYDIREKADQPRGEFAGHFFMVDAVGLDDSDRPVPWEVLARRVGMQRLEQLTALFDEVEKTVE